MLERCYWCAAPIIVLGVSVPCAAAAQTPSIPQTRDPKPVRSSRFSRPARPLAQPSDPGTRDLSERRARPMAFSVRPIIDPDHGRYARRR